MTTKTATREIKLTDTTVKVSIERGTWEEEIRLDGTLCSTKTNAVDRTEIALYDGSKRLAYGKAIDPLPRKHSDLAKAIKAGCVGIVGGRWFIKSDTADAIRAALAELDAENPKTAEMTAIEQAEQERKRIGEQNMARIEAERRERNSHPGWCNKCHSYCYGDCTAN
jgi:hypothetical protein